jgi:hypothetical protein
MAAICAPGGNCRHSSKPQASASRRHDGGSEVPAVGDLAQMLIGVYQGLFSAAAELGIADPVRAEAFRRDMAEAAADGRYYCLTPILIGAWRRVA